MANCGKIRMGSQPSVEQTFSREEIKTNGLKGRCIFNIENKVYDVTDFLPEHPGGQKFLEVGHSPAALKKTNNFLVGDFKDFGKEQKKDERQKVTVLFGTQFGTSKKFSREIAKLGGKYFEDIN